MVSFISILVAGLSSHVGPKKMQYSRPETQATVGRFSKLHIVVPQTYSSPRCLLTRSHDHPLLDKYSFRTVDECLPQRKYKLNIVMIVNVESGKFL